MNRWRQFMLVLSLLGAVFAVSGPTASPILAQVGGGACAHGNNVGSNACRNGAYSEVYTGAYASWTSKNMYLDQAHYNEGWHINQEMWFYTRTDENQWVELGERNGQAIGGDPCGTCLAYEVFWADFDSVGAEHAHYIANTTPDGVGHNYEIWGNGDKTWNVYYDGNYAGMSTNQPSALGYEDEVGSEISCCAQPWSHSDTFDFTSLLTRDQNGSWTSWPYVNTWIDAPCGGYPQGSCLNGVAPNTSEWLNNKP